MIDPIFWLVLSFLLVSMSLTAVLVVLVPAVRELSRAARSVEKLCDTLDRELPPTLESIRLTSTELTNLTDDMNQGVQNASRVARQVDQSMNTVRMQAQRVQIGTRSLMAGFNAALSTLIQAEDKRDLHPRPRGNPHQQAVTKQPTMPSSQGPSPESDYLSQSASAGYLSDSSPQKMVKPSFEESDKVDCVPHPPKSSSNRMSEDAP